MIANPHPNVRRTSVPSPPNGWKANPFNGPEHFCHSAYFARDNGRLRCLSRETPDPAQNLLAATADGAFRALIDASDYPCVGAKSTVHRDSYRLGLYGKLGGAGATAGLCRDLYRFSREYERLDADFATFAAVFAGPRDLDELGFERQLWRQLQALHVKDAPLHAWDKRVDHDPDSDAFSFSFGGEAFFIVGLHPAASRAARRFPWPTLIFNAHAQFDRLRDAGRMERMKQVIRQKDTQLQGHINPMLRDFGDASEARQYSGRHVGEDWSPPFKAVADGESEGDEAVARRAAAAGCPFHTTQPGEEGGR